jgi:bla regulator protein blaR1
MIAAWMLYWVAIATLFVVFGEALERALHLAGRATRCAWVVALAGSCVVPAAAWLRPNAFGTLPVPLGQAVANGPMMSPPVSSTTFASMRSFSLGDLDAVLMWAWGLSSAALLLSLGAAALRLAALRRGWRSATVDGRVVLVSDNVGPAVAGLWPSRVVLPEWALGLGEGERRLMLAHEEEHVRARDPWLLAAATATLVLAPWNPVLWWQVRRLRLSVEMDCDARVLMREGDAPAYGELLLRVAQCRAHLPLGAAALGEPASFLGRRIRRIATALPRWRWAGASAASILAAAAVVLACEAPRPVGTKATTDPRAVAQTDPVSKSPDASYVQRLAHEYHPDAFVHPRPGAAIALVFDNQDSMIGHAAGVREARDNDCLAVVNRLVPAFLASAWSSGGCADAADKGKVVVYWKKLKQAEKGRGRTH